MWIVKSIDIRLIYERQIKNILSKCMFVETHFVVAFHFCAHFILLSSFNHLLIIFCLHLKHLWFFIRSIESWTHRSMFQLMQMHQNRNTHLSQSHSRHLKIETQVEFAATQNLCLFFSFYFFFSFRSTFDSVLSIDSFRLFSFFWLHEQQHV